MPMSINAKTGNFSLLPAKTAAAYYTSQILPDARFKRYYQHFTALGFKFMPERVQVAVAISAVKGATVSPFMLSIVPSFRKFEPTAASHDAVSIVILRSGSVNSVTAGTATIGHKPYQLQSLGITDIDTQGKAYSTSMSRSDLSKLSVAKLASSANQLMGLVPKFGADEPGLDPDDIAELTALTYSNLLNDKYAKPLYPPSGLKSMMADTQLTQKLALVNRARFAGSAALAIKLCSSSSTSSNACTSTSSSCIEL